MMEDNKYREYAGKISVRVGIVGALLLYICMITTISLVSIAQRNYQVESFIFSNMKFIIFGVVWLLFMGTMIGIAGLISLKRNYDKVCQVCDFREILDKATKSN